jgi:hypothetical protein
MEKQCKRCKDLGIGPKPGSEFNKSTRAKTGLADYCRVHAAEKLRRCYKLSGSKYNEQKKVWRKKNPEAARILDVRKYIRGAYGLSESQYTAMFLAQNGCCGICAQELRSQFDPTREFTARKKVSNVAYVDHDHATNFVRGLLCFSCNIILGKAKDDEKILLKAVGYLRASATQQAQPVAGRESASEIEPGNRDLDSNVSRGSRRDELSPFN